MGAVGRDSAVSIGKASDNKSKVSLSRLVQGLAPVMVFEKMIEVRLVRTFRGSDGSIGWRAWHLPWALKGK